nr:MAG TPA: putative nucleotidyltransferase [Bacteriophage sp.]
MILVKENEIKEIIKRKENTRDIKFLCVVPNGSRAYGTESWNSDIDVRGIYIEPLSEYLRLERSKDCFSATYYDGVDIDLQAYSLDKTLKLISKSNPNILEWLNVDNAYSNFWYINQLREIADEYFDVKRCLYHYIGMAKKDLKAHSKYVEEDKVIKVKHLLNIFRCVFYCHSMIRDGEFPTLDIMDNIPAILDTYRLNNGKLFTQYIVDLINKKKTDKDSVIILENDVDTWLEERIKNYKYCADELKSKKIDMEKLNRVFYDLVTEYDNLKVVI